MPSLNRPTSKPPHRAAAVPDHPLSPAGSTYAILDANALLPPRLSDVLFDLRDLYFPRWTVDIETEFLRNWAQVVKRLKGAELKAYKAASPHSDDEDKAEKRLNAYRNAVGDEYGLIGYGANHIAKQVPAAVNKGDMHVAQAAILMHYLLVSEGMVSDRMLSGVQQRQPPSSQRHGGAWHRSYTSWRLRRSVVSSSQRSGGRGVGANRFRLDNPDIHQGRSIGFSEPAWGQGYRQTFQQGLECETSTQ